jgi:hypothetical protein
MSFRNPLLVSLTLALIFPGSARAADNGAAAVCRFSNAAFSGYCTERVAVSEGSTPGKACGEILDCLNSTGCTKSYCQSTTIRGGWKLESAGPEKGRGKK